jgi:hypothetical protein
MVRILFLRRCETLDASDASRALAHGYLAQRTPYHDTSMVLRRFVSNRILHVCSVDSSQWRFRRPHSAVGPQEHGQRNEHCRYSDPFWGPSFPYHAGIYDSDYSYTPTPEQQATAKRQVEAYLLAVKKRRKHAATHRYISVETLRPTKKQLEDFTMKQPQARRVEPAQLHCLMVFDTQAREFVGSGCYVVSSEPLAGAVAKFESVSAEFVGHETL